MENDIAFVRKRLASKLEALKSAAIAGLAQIEQSLSERMPTPAPDRRESDERYEPVAQRTPAAKDSDSNPADDSWTTLQIQHTELEDWGNALRHQMAMLCLAGARPAAAAAASDAAAAAAAERRCAARITRRAKRFLRSHPVGGPAAAAAAARLGEELMGVGGPRRLTTLPMKQYKATVIEQVPP